MALDLYQHTLQQGSTSHFVYGYGEGGRGSVSHQDYPQVIKHTPRMVVMADITLFRLPNRDLFGNFNELYRTITRTPGPVVLHSHVLCSYQLNLKSVVRLCERVKNHKPDITLVWTLCGHWSVTGRCVFTDDYEGWKTGCQECPTLNNYPPVKIDRAHQLVADKHQLLREMLILDCQFVSPNQHVADAFDSLYGPGHCRTIDNGIDMVTEAVLADLPPMHETQDRPGIAVMAYDLRYGGKTNQQLVHEMIVLGDKIELHIFGGFSSFIVDNAVNHGFETDKRRLTSALNQTGILVFSSHVDNYPLVLCEALSVSVPVIVAHSDTVQEALQRSDGKTVSGEDVLQLMQLSKPETTQAVSDTTLAEFNRHSRAAYGRQRMLEEYVNPYQSLQLPTTTADLPVG